MLDLAEVKRLLSKSHWRNKTLDYRFCKLPNFVTSC